MTQSKKLSPVMQGKVLQANYDDVFSREGEFAPCLTSGQIAWILSQVDYAGWWTRWDSPSGQEIDSVKIELFKADLARRLMSNLKNCEDSTMYLLRQNAENSCLLEQSTDGGINWTDAFDYSLCFRQNADNAILERLNGIYKGLQRSYDGGETWVDAPDYRTTTPITANPYTGEADPACKTSGQVVAYFQEFLIVDDEQLLIAIIQFLIQLLAVVVTGGALAGMLVTTIAQAIVQLGIEAFQAAMTTEEWEKFFCNLYTHAETDGSWTLESYFAILDQVAIDHTGAAQFFLAQILISVGWAGLNNAGHLAYENTMECIDCANCSNLEKWGVVYGTLLEQSPGYMKIASAAVGGNQAVRIATWANGGTNTDCCYVVGGAEEGGGVFTNTAYYPCGSDTPINSIPPGGSCGHDYNWTNVFGNGFVMEITFTDCP